MLHLTISEGTGPDRQALLAISDQRVIRHVLTTIVARLTIPPMPPRPRRNSA